MVDAIRATKGVEVDRRHILLPEHIKETGCFDVTVELFADVATVVTVEVTRRHLSGRWGRVSAGRVTPECAPWCGAIER